MKISELRARENYDENLLSILQNCLERDKSLNPAEPLQNVQWFEHPIFSVYITQDFCDDGRRYLNDMYRHAPRLIRRPIQALATDIMTEPHLFKCLLKPRFELPIAGNPKYQMWMPGNHRFRRFDFQNRTIRIYPKKGFSDAGIRREISLRQKWATQFDWILPIFKIDASRAVFDEPLLEAIPFNRVSRVKRRQNILQQIPKILTQLHDCQQSVVTGRTYLAQKRTQLEAAYRDFSQIFPGIQFNLIEQIWQRAANILKDVDKVQMSMTHGDFQPGNLLIATEENNEGCWLIDWEDANLRASVYDEMTWHLNSRSPRGLHKRVIQFLESPQNVSWSLGEPAHVSVALWAIEEGIWLLESSSRQGITQLPEGLCQQFKECGAYLCTHANGI